MTKQLWAPWRLSYIVTAKDDDDNDGCFLCRYHDQDNDAENFVVARGERTLVVLNRYPYNNGHLLIAPAEHKGGLEELDDGELLECMQQVQRMTAALAALISPDGFNVGLNLGRAAGAGLPGHLHWHIVPRWNGDTNFMSIIDDVTVIPQSLRALYELLTTVLRDEE
jgi:ATP adenylyltransferase